MRFVQYVSGAFRQARAIFQSTGQSDAHKIVETGDDGRLHETLLPTGIGAETVGIAASEALAAGALVAIYTDSGGAVAVRNADATAPGKTADGFVLDAAAADATATVYIAGLNTGVASLTPGAAYYLATTAGGVTTTPPTGDGTVAQYVGRATAAGTLAFERGTPVVLAAA